MKNNTISQSLKNTTLKIVFALALFSLISFSGYSTHIVGGELNYKCLGNNLYEIHLRVYRDCYNGTAPFDNPAYVGIFDVNNKLIRTISLPFPGSTVLPPTLAQNNPCVKIPTNICVEVAEYIGTVTLPPIVGGYQLAYQRCCRNSTIDNLTNPGNQGATYYAVIPDQTVVACNSNPIFKNWPPIFVCANNPIIFDHSATDADGDSIYYDLCAPFTGATGNNSQPNPPTAPPYSNVTFKAPYSATDPMGGTPLTIDPKTGLMVGIPTTVGQYVVGVCATEFRKGVRLSTTKRDFQFNVVACQADVVASFATALYDCTNHTVKFINNSTGATNFLWDFGDPTTTTDVSTLTNPTWTYSALGTYTVRLIAFQNSNAQCNDTLDFLVTVDTCKPCAMTLGISKVDATCGASVGGCTATPTSLGEWANNTKPNPDPCPGTGINVWYIGTTDPIGTSSSNTYYLCGATYYTITQTEFNNQTEPTGNSCPGTGSFVLRPGNKYTYVCPCSGGGTGALGTATVTPLGGTPTYTYTWSTNPVQSTGTATNLTAGTYTVSVQDASGCRQTASVIIDANSTIALTTAQTSPTTCGATDGTASVTATGGTSPFTYLWSNGGTNDNISGLPVGVYSVNVIDAAGCTKSQQFTIGQATAITFTASSTDVKCKGGSDGTATANNPTAGSAPFSYSWSTTPTKVGQAVTGLKKGYYVVTVTDVGGCTGTASVTIIESSLTLTPSSTSVSCFAGSNGTATISASLGTPGYTYSWNTSPVQTTPTATGLMPGTYTGVVTDNGGCKDSVKVTITQPSVIVPEPKNTSTVACAGATNGSAAVFVSGGTAPYSYSWCNGSSQSTATALPQGKCFITITDFAGCVATDTINIVYPPVLSATITSSDIKCFGANNGAASVNPTGGQFPYTYAWTTTPAQITSTAINLSIGTYTVLVTDHIGCTATASVSISGSSATAINLAISSTNVTCSGARDGTATVSVSGGTPTYTYSWNTSPAQITPKASGLSGGTYIVTVVDANGCNTNTSTVVLDINQIPVANFTAIFQPTCHDGLVAQFLNASTSASSYLWIFGDGTTSNEKDPEHGFEYGTTATVLLIARNGNCSDTMSLNVTANPFADYIYPFIPNVFSPNGDGINDVFDITVGNGLENCVQITIFDRWGLKMYENSDGTPWGGKNKSGKAVPEGTYFYIVQIGDNKLKGSLSLVR